MFLYEYSFPQVINEVDIMENVKILWKFTENLGEEFDDEENFVGFKTRTTLKENIVPISEVSRMIKLISEIPSDYGDGVTNARVICIVDSETNEFLPISYDYWNPSEEEDSE